MDYRINHVNRRAAVVTNQAILQLRAREWKSTAAGPIRVNVVKNALSDAACEKIVFEVVIVVLHNIIFQTASAYNVPLLDIDRLFVAFEQADRMNQGSLDRYQFMKMASTIRDGVPLTHGQVKLYNCTQ